jgi:hypothetical protein
MLKKLLEQSKNKNIKVYTLRKSTETEELHLFEGEITSDDKCSLGAKSICDGMSKSDGTNNIFACQPEDKARIECAKQGRKVCGVCVSHLYTTYK